jgi:FtsP/CotA-like multicopper oxidase with cupredoxin domain
MYVFNPTNDAHPIHIHLVTHQVVARYKINSAEYLAAFEEINGKIGL